MATTPGKSFRRAGDAPLAKVANLLRDKALHARKGSGTRLALFLGTETP